MLQPGNPRKFATTMLTDVDDPALKARLDAVMRGAVNLREPSVYLRDHNILEFFLLLGEKV